jgi:hypothetical protein
MFLTRLQPQATGDVGAMERPWKEGEERDEALNARREWNR